MSGKIFSPPLLNVFFRPLPPHPPPPPLANIFGKNSGQKIFFAAGHHRLSQDNSSSPPPWLETNTCNIRIMILEELIGSFVALFTELIQTPRLSRGTLPRDCSLIFEENPEQDEVCDGFIHREYEQGGQPDLPYYEEELSALVQTNQERRRNFCESFLRSCKANVGLVMKAFFIIGSLIVGLVYLDLNTSNACIEWVHNKLVVSSHVRILQMTGMSLKLLPLYAWCPTTVFLLWGFREFKKNYLLCLFICQLVTASVACVYGIIVFDKLEIFTDYSKYR